MSAAEKAEDVFRQGAMEALRERAEQLRGENELLKKQREKSEKDTHEFVAYFQQELEKKDDLIAKLNDQLLRSELQGKRVLEGTTAQHTTLVEEMRQEHSTQVAKLKSNLKLAKDELSSLTEFRHTKFKMEQELHEAKEQLRALEEKGREDMLNLERRLLEQKRKTQQDHEAEMERVRRQARVEAQQGLDADTRKIVNDNLRMGEELKFQLESTDELQSERDSLASQNKELRRKLQLASENEQLLVRQTHLKSREGKELHARVKALEMSLAQVVRDAEREREGIVLRHKRRLEEGELEMAGLRQLVKLKNKELRTMKRLAQTVLDQRTEVEQFFLDALQQVRREVAQRRAEEGRMAQARYRSQMRSAMKQPGVKFPPVLPGLKPADALGRSTSTSSVAARDGKVDLKDLSWEDRERVLRLLFAKINNVQGFTHVLPDEALRPDHPEEGASADGGWGEGGETDRGSEQVFVTETRVEPAQGATAGQSRPSMA